MVNYVKGLPLKFVKYPLTMMGQVNFGESAAGYDVYFYSETSGSYILWDASAATLYFVGEASIDIGASEDGVDTTFYGDTAGVTSMWDASNDAFIFTGADIQLKDGDKLVFGTGSGVAGDVQISFTDGTGLSVVGSAGNENLLLGSDTYLLDVTLKGDLTLSGDNAITVGSRTAGSGADLATVTTGVLAAVQYTDGATLANTYDYCGMAGIFDLTIGRAITLASGGGYGWAALNGSVTISKAIASTGGLSAGWFAIWAEASGGDAALTESTRIQAIDAALVTGSAFNAGASTSVYGVRIDSSVNASATLSGNFSALHIGKSSGKLDWAKGVEIENCTTSIDIGACTTGITFTGATTTAINLSSATVDNTKMVNDTRTNASALTGTAYGFYQGYTVSTADQGNNWLVLSYKKLDVDYDCGTTSHAIINGNKVVVSQDYGCVYNGYFHSEVDGAATLGDISSVYGYLKLSAAVTCSEYVAAGKFICEGTGLVGTGSQQVLYLGLAGGGTVVDDIININCLGANDCNRAVIHIQGVGGFNDDSVPCFYVEDLRAGPDRMAYSSTNSTQNGSILCKITDASGTSTGYIYLYSTP